MREGEQGSCYYTNMHTCIHTNKSYIFTPIGNGGSDLLRCKSENTAHVIIYTYIHTYTHAYIHTSIGKVGSELSRCERENTAHVSIRRGPTKSGCTALNCGCRP